MVAAGNDSVVMEATSHGLALGAHAQLPLRRRHPDQPSPASTWSSTARSRLPRGQGDASSSRRRVAILNADDASFGYFRDRAAGPVITYGIEADAELRASAIDASATGTAFDARPPRLVRRGRCALPGRFNVHNALAALALAAGRGDRPGTCRRRRWRDVAGVPGRMETGRPGPAVRRRGRLRAHGRLAGQGAAHPAPADPRAADRGLRLGGGARSDQAPGHGSRGCGAGRCRGRHRRRSAAGGCRAINEAIARGARSAGAREGETLFVIDDRPSAIGHAIGLARDGDVILLAGKGHEKTIIYGTRGSLVGREGSRAARAA